MDGFDGPDRALGDQRRDLAADRRLEPIVNRMHNAPGAPRSRRDDLGVARLGDQGLLAKHVETRAERLLDKRCMGAGRRADVDEIECFARQKGVEAIIPAAFRASREKRLPARGGRVGRRDHPDILAGPPAGQVSLFRDVSEADESPTKHPPHSSPKRRAMAAND